MIEKNSGNNYSYVLGLSYGPIRGSFLYFIIIQRNTELLAQAQQETINILYIFCPYAAQDSHQHSFIFLAILKINAKKYNLVNILFEKFLLAPRFEPAIFHPGNIWCLSVAHWEVSLCSHSFPSYGSQ